MIANLPFIEARAQSGLSRERLAALAGISARTIYNIERKGAQPHEVTRLALAQALDREPDTIFSVPPPRPCPHCNGTGRAIEA